MSTFNRSRLENLYRLAETAYLNPGLSKTEYARRLGIDKSTAGDLVEELCGRQILVATSNREIGPQGGRPSQPYDFNVEYGYSIGLELERGLVRGVAVDPAGRLLAQRSSRDNIDSSTVTAVIAREVHFLQEAADRRISAFVGGALSVALGISGIVDTEAGSVVYSTGLGIEEELYLAPLVEEQVGIPTFLFNDADACALGELGFGNIDPDGDLLFLLVELRPQENPPILGAGLGIVLNGELRHGKHNGAGEFRSVAQSDHARTQFRVTDEYTARSMAGRLLVEQFAEELATNVALIANVLDLDNVVVGGDVEEFFSIVHSALDRRIRGLRVVPGNHQLRVALPEWSRDPVPYGSARAGFHRLFVTHRFPFISSTVASAESESDITPQGGM
jgi:predicted NBD/HSP70 family sugar kinase